MWFTSSQELLDRYGPSIRGVAFEIHASTRGTIEREEFFHLGVEGMLDAARRFDPRLGVQFWTFAYPRVRGTMVDAIRQSMPLPSRLHRRRGAAEAALRTTVPGTRAHEDATRRLAEATEAVGLVSPEVLAIARGETLGVCDGDPGDASLDGSDGSVAGPPDDDGSDRVIRVDQPSAVEQLETARRAAAIHAAMRRLTVEERMIVRGLYFEARGLLDIGAELGVSKSWASRIHTRALGRLKKELACDWGYEPESERVWGAQSAPHDWIDVLLEGAESGEVDTSETEDAEGTEVANAA